MAMSSNKSPSLAPSRSKPNARNSEINNPMRRSFSGNPFSKPSVIENPRSFNPSIPANSSSDFPRRHSVGGRENVGFFHDVDDKENGKDQILKPGKVRSPAAAKNFMSPTISASSKIANSPRKKVLTERNEPARISISSTDGKSPIRKVTFAEPLIDSDLKPGVGLEEKKLETSSGRIPKEEEKDESSIITVDLKFEEAVLEENKVPFNPNNETLNLDTDTESSFLTLSEKPDCVNLDPTFKVPFNPNNETLNLDTDTESSFLTLSEKPDCVNLDPTFKLSPTPPPVSSTSTILAPLDADPLVPPYDPKTNYLSPRPQFLCYKPNRRVELYKEREGTHLEENLISGSYSDTEVTEETQPEDSQKDSDDVSSDEILNIEEEGHSSISTPTKFMSTEVVEATKLPKSRFFTRSNVIVLIFLLSIASISFSVMNCPVIGPTAIKYRTNFSKVYESSEYSEFAKANFDRLARNSHIWFTYFKSSVSELVHNFRGGHNWRQFHYYNLTALHEDNSLDEYPIFGHSEKGKWDTLQVDLPVLNVEENEVDVATDIQKADDFEELFEQNMVDVPGVGHEIVSDAPESEDVIEIQQDTLVEPSRSSASNHSELNTEVKEDYLQVMIDVPGGGHEIVSDAPESGDVIGIQQATLVKPSQPSAPNPSELHTEVKEDYQSLSSEAAEIPVVVVEESNLDADQAQENGALKEQPELNSKVADVLTDANEDGTGNTELTETEAEENSASVDAEFRENQHIEAVNFPPNMLLYVLLLFISLVAAVAFNYSRKDKSRSQKAAKTLKVGSSSVSKEQVSLNKQSLRNGPTEMDILGESCPSEMSSSGKSSAFYSQKVVKEVNEESCPSEMRSSEKSSSSSSQKVVKEVDDEAQSLGKKPKKNYGRESLASSSSDYSIGVSTSYGSFTTFEKRSNKHGNGDEDTVTPVRRSSRIRNQATSPLRT